MSNPTDQRWVQHPHALVRHLPDGLLVLSPGLDEPLAIRGPAASAWEILESQPTFDEIVDSLATTFHAPHEQIRADITTMWDHLVTTRTVVPAT